MGPQARRLGFNTPTKKIVHNQICHLRPPNWANTHDMFINDNRKKSMTCTMSFPNTIDFWITTAMNLSQKRVCCIICGFEVNEKLDAFGKSYNTPKWQSRQCKKCRKHAH